MSHHLSFWGLVALVTGNLVGSGVFMLPATLAPYGTLSIFGWLITTLGAILLSLLFGQLSTQFPRSGGPHVYVEEAFGPFIGYFTAWGYWVLSWISNAALVVAITGYASMIFSGLSILQILMFELSIIAVVTAINLRAIEFAGRVELYLTFIKIIPLIIIPLIGLSCFNSEHFSVLNPTSQSWSHSINAVALITIWGYIGLETGTVPSGEVQNSAINVPKAIIVGTLIAATVYILGTVSIMGALTSSQLSSSVAPYADLAHIVFGGNWSWVISLLAIISCFGALNGWVLVVGRISYGAAQNGLFPSIFQKTTSQGAPKWGLIISSTCAVPFVMMTLKKDLVQQFNFIVDVSVTLIMFIYLACVLAYIKFIYQNKINRKRSWALALSSLIFIMWALSVADYSMLSYSWGIFALGIPMYIYMKLKNPLDYSKSLSF